MEINETIVKETNDCKKNFSCLKTKEHDFCRVRRCISNSVHFIECIDSNNCNYKIAFGDCQICTCPIRKEIFNKYNL
jgi:hypothetical protein